MKTEMIKRNSKLRFIRVFSSSSSKQSTLCRRIEAIKDPKALVLPVLDRWLNEGNRIRKPLLRSLLHFLKDYNRFNHALEISNWMSNRPFFKLSSSDVADRLELIYRVYGSSKAEQYFEQLSDDLKCYPVYCALLNGYVQDNSVQKAETLMQEMREKGIAKSSLPYNMLINLYIQIGDSKKIDLLVHEMERNGVAQGAYTTSNVIAAYAAALNLSGMERILYQVEKDSQSGCDWRVYSAAANGYLKFGSIEKALAMLRKMEDVMPLEKNTTAFDVMLALYAKTGKKDELFLVWNTYKPLIEVKETSYMCMISSLLMMDDIEGAEKIFKDLESKCKMYDFSILNKLLAAYCKKGLFEKAEKAAERAAKGRALCPSTWNVLAKGFMERNNMSKAVEMLKRTISVAGKDWRPNPTTLNACLDYLEEQGDIEGMEEITESLKRLEPLTRDAYRRLTRMYTAAGKPVSEILDRMKMDEIAADDDTQDS